MGKGKVGHGIASKDHALKTPRDNPHADRRGGCSGCVCGQKSRIIDLKSMIVGVKNLKC